MIDLQPIAGLNLELGEGPVWDDRRNLVFLCDIPSGRVLSMRLDGSQLQEWSFGSAVGSLGLCESGRLIVALAREITLFDPETSARETVVRLEGEPETNRFNDGKVGPDGAFWVGTMDQRSDRQPIGALYRLGGNGQLDRRKEGILVSNGLAWSPDGRRLYHSDSAGRWIDAHDFDPGPGIIGPAERLAELTESDGRPDGAATDAEGFYWSAGVSAACLNRFSPEGVLVEKYPVPVAAPTMPCFCGPDLRTLLVTSHRYATPERLAAYPLTGSVLVGHSPIAGASVPRMKGF